MRNKILFSWSSGKESTTALYNIIKNNTHEIVSLLTIVTEDYDRISMHGVRRALLEKQAESTGFPIEIIYISKNGGNEEYESHMRETLTLYRDKGISGVAFGDIFLEDVREYRESRLSELGLQAFFPNWNRNTEELAKEFINSEFKSIVTCIDSTMLAKEFTGREFDMKFLEDLPDNVDPCGENGEYHSFVHKGPLFNKPILFRKGEIVLRDNRYYYCDLLSVN